jgi:hypothetical protein
VIIGFQRGVIDMQTRFEKLISLVTTDTASDEIVSQELLEIQKEVRETAQLRPSVILNDVIEQ